MSFSSLQSQRYLIEVEILTLLLQRYISNRNNAVSEEQKYALESEAVLLFEKLLDLDFSLQEILPLTYVNTQQLYSSAVDYEILASIAIVKLRKLTELFLQHYNSNQAQLLSVIGKLRRAKQKKSVLKLWNSTDAKYLLAEAFNNLDAISSEEISQPACTVNTGEGLLTLPVKLQKNLNVKKISVSAGSNGIPGNSDIEVTTNNTGIDNVLKNDPNLWFEYERLDGGPLTLNLNVELNTSEIVNAMYLVPINLGTSMACRVDDILFSIDGSSTKSIKTLVSPNLEKTVWEVKALTTNGWSISFLPVKAKTIVIKLIQDQSYRIPVATAGSSRDRERFAIGLKHLSVKRLTYAKSGALVSVGEQLPTGLYSGLGFADVFPLANDLYDVKIDISLDDGDTWEALGSLSNGVAKAFLLDGEESLFRWRMNLARNNEALKQVTSFIPDSSLHKSTKSMIRTASTAHSPFLVTLPEKPHQGRVMAVQSKVTRRGSRHKRLTIGYGTGTSSSIGLPFDILNTALEAEEVHVFVNGTEYVNNPDNLAVSAEEWAFTDDFRELQFSADLSLNSKVELVLDPELMDFELRADGYYHQMELLFDPDKDSITVESLPRNAAKTSVTLPKDKTLINLGYKNILNDSFQLTSRSSGTYTEVSTRALVLSTLNSFYVDYPNGLLWLHAPTNGDTVRVSFNHATGLESAKEDFSIVYGEDGVSPWGIKISSDRFACIAYTDTVGVSPGKTVNLRTGVYGVRPIGLSTETTAKTLTYDRIVRGTVVVSDNLLNTVQRPEEVVFIDGITEFYGLVHIEDEKTTAITATADTVTFKLSAGALWFGELGVHFSNTSIFSVLKSSSGAVISPGDYFIDVDGTVVVYIGIGGTLLSDIEISYYYKNPEFDSKNKYSIDYKRGIIYSSNNLHSGATINYKASNYKISYDVARHINAYSYDKSTNSVSIRTEELHKINNLIKVIWAESDSGESLTDMVDYFSPLISILGFRFT